MSSRHAVLALAADSQRSARPALSRLTLARFALGAYLVVHCVQLLPYARELFSSLGMLADASASPFHAVVPNPLFSAASPWLAPRLVLVGIALGLVFALGVHERAAAAALWLVWLWLYTRNPLIGNPSLPFVGFVLLAHATLGAPSAARSHSPWLSAPGVVFVVLAIGYSYSGYTKLVSPSWLDGSALRHVLQNPLARPSALRDMLLEAPEVWLAAMSYGVLALELAFAPLCLHPALRRLAFVAMTAMHLGIVLLVDFADLSLGMLAVHAYAAWPLVAKPRLVAR